MSDVQMYSNGLLAYDNKLSKYAMQSILISEALNTGGTCTLILFPGHPAATYFPAFSVPVEIYRDGKLRWRGRPLPLTDELHGLRTIVCEGELCWLNDIIIRPYLYQTDPKSIFTDLIEKYNEKVGPWKRFVVGNVTVTDPNDYIRLESTTAQKIYAVVMKLVDRCGGYIFFESLEDGTRTINWYADLPYSCSQPIEFGRNLLDCIKEANVANFATRIIPYGAELDDGTRLQINVDGKDYLQDDEAIALRGTIEATETWDDVTMEANLITKAAAWLSEAKKIPYSINLSALDLSKLGQCVDAFAVGQRVPVASAPHELDGYFDLTALSEDLCDPRVGEITLGRETASLIGTDAASRKSTEESLRIAMQEVNNQKSELKNFAVSVETQITSAVQDSQAIVFTALESYAQISDVKKVEENLAQLALTANDVAIRVTSIEDNGVTMVKTSMGYTFDDAGLNIEKEGEQIHSLLNHLGLKVIRGSGDVMLSATDEGVVATDVKVNNYLIIGHSRFEEYNDGTDDQRTGLFWVGG